jgi:hypothetical protein
MLRLFTKPFLTSRLKTPFSRLANQTSRSWLNRGSLSHSFLPSSVHRPIEFSQVRSFSFNQHELSTQEKKIQHLLHHCYEEQSWHKLMAHTPQSDIAGYLQKDTELLKLKLRSLLYSSHLSDKKSKLNFLLSFHPTLNFYDGLDKGLIRLAVSEPDYAELIDLLWQHDDARWITHNLLLLAAFHDPLGEYARIRYFVNRGARVDLTAIPAITNTIPLAAVDLSDQITKWLAIYEISGTDNFEENTAFDKALKKKLFPVSHFIAPYVPENHLHHYSITSKIKARTEAVALMIHMHNQWIKTLFNLKLGLEACLLGKPCDFSAAEKHTLEKLNMHTEIDYSVIYRAAADYDYRSNAELITTKLVELSSTTAPEPTPDSSDQSTPLTPQEESIYHLLEYTIGDYLWPEITNAEKYFAKTPKAEIAEVFRKKPELLEYLVCISLTGRHQSGELENIRFLCEFHPIIDFYITCNSDHELPYRAIEFSDYKHFLDNIWRGDDGEWVTNDLLLRAAFHDPIGKFDRIKYFIDRGAALHLDHVLAMKLDIPLVEIDIADTINNIFIAHDKALAKDEYQTSAKAVKEVKDNFPLGNFVQEYDLAKHSHLFKHEKAADSWASSIRFHIFLHNQWIKTLFNLKLGLETCQLNKPRSYTADELAVITKYQEKGFNHCWGFVENIVADYRYRYDELVANQAANEASHSRRLGR